jgi:hypothetical protein
MDNQSQPIKFTGNNKHFAIVETLIVINVDNRYLSRDMTLVISVGSTWRLREPLPRAWVSRSRTAEGIPDGKAGVKDRL